VKFHCPHCDEDQGIVEILEALTHLEAHNKQALDRIEAQLGVIVSQQDDITQIENEENEALAAIEQHASDLDAEIAKLEAAAAQPGATPLDLSGLKAIADRMKADATPTTPATAAPVEPPADAGTGDANSGAPA
jgi:chromosome segregation ATPase